MFRELTVSTGKREDFIDITQQLLDFISTENLRNGILTVFVPHTTAAVTVNENADPDVIRDLLDFTSKMIPDSCRFRHSEGNSDSHVKSSLFSPQISLIVENGRLMLGTWQSVYFAEFDGPRGRKFFIKFIPG